MEDLEPVLNVSGPLTVKEVEAHVFLAARDDPELEASQRAWMDEERSYFIRWREPAAGSPLAVVGLVYVSPLPEMASQVRLVAFDEQAGPPAQAALQRYAGLLRQQLAAEGFA